VLFLAAMWFAPIAGVIPAQATAPALVLVGFYMMAIARDISWDDHEEAVPAFVTMLAMPFTWSITNGIGAGFLTYAIVKVATGKARQVHPLMYAVCGAFVLYFLEPLVERALR
jgi:adenine/guanine/hypoxanthine permease